MATITWKNTGSGDWNTGTLWAGNVAPGAFDSAVFAAGSTPASIAEGETITIQGLNQSDGILTIGGFLRLNAAAIIGAAAEVDGGSALGGNGRIRANVSLLNQGSIISDIPGTTLQIDAKSLTNTGFMAATNQSILFLTSNTSTDTGITNLASGVLTGGTWEVSGNGSALNTVGPFNFPASAFGDGRVVVDNATIILDGPGSAWFGWNPNRLDSQAGTFGIYDQIELSLSTITAAGELDILGGRDFVGANPLTNNGILALAGGTLDPLGITNNSGAFIVGFGTIADQVISGGLVEAQGGTLTLAGGILDAGALQVDPNATLSFNGSFTGAISNSGAIMTTTGLMLGNGAQAANGAGGFLIQGGTQEGHPDLIAGPTTTLELAGSTSGNVTFNGAGASLRLDAPASYAGTLIGYGAGNTLDIRGITADSATVSSGFLTLSSGGTPIYSMAISGDYSGASFTAASGPSGTTITVSGVDPLDFAFNGPIWATKTITWSLAAFQYGSDAATPFSRIIDPIGDADVVNIVQAAFDRWAGIAGFNFVQVTDSGDPASSADIRVGWGNLQPNLGGEIGQASFSSIGGFFQPDVLVRLEDPTFVALDNNPAVIGGLSYHGFTSTLYQVAVHEIGHALGLFHSTDPHAVMNPTAQGITNQDTNASDIAGILTLYANAPCFAAGSAILTACGPVAVEDLAIGTLVPTLQGGQLRPIRWIGHRSVQPARHHDPAAVTPISVAANAFGRGQPSRDLVLSPDHAIFVDGVLVPVRHLVNGATIRRTPMDEVTYYHVELADRAGAPLHGILLAEGLTCESFLDTGNRDAFADSPAPQLHPDFARRAWDATACAPLHEGGAIVAAIRATLLRQAATLGHTTTDDPDLHLIANGRRIDAHRTGDLWRFDVPAGPITLASRTTIPADIRPADPDRRPLGIALAELRLDGRPLPLTDPRLNTGFHPIEPQGWRWTDGAGVLTLDTPATLELRLGPPLTYWANAAPSPAPSMPASTTTRHPAAR